MELLSEHSWHDAVQDSCLFRLVHLLILIMRLHSGSLNILGTSFETLIVTVSYNKISAIRVVCFWKIHNLERVFSFMSWAYHLVFNAFLCLIHYSLHILYWHYLMHIERVHGLSHLSSRSRQQCEEKPLLFNRCGLQWCPLCGSNISMGRREIWLNPKKRLYEVSWIFFCLTAVWHWPCSICHKVSFFTNSFPSDQLHWLPPG